MARNLLFNLSIQEISIVLLNTINNCVFVSACLMIAAWMIMGGIGMLVARYCKASWKLEIDKIKFWFWVSSPLEYIFTDFIHLKPAFFFFNNCLPASPITVSLQVPERQIH